jgi:hemerythrin-like domain-containing protein
MKKDPEALLRLLTIAHAALRRSLASIIKFSSSPLPASDQAPFIDYVTRFLEFLHTHHGGEDEVLFPGLSRCFERAGAAGQEAAQALRVWGAEHTPVIDMIKAMREDLARLSGGSPEALGHLHAAAGKLQETLIPHLDSEEKGLTGKLLAPLLSLDEMSALGDALMKYEQKHSGSKILMFFIHSLDAHEQVEFFGELPWIIRRILVKRIWAPGYRPLLKFSYAQASAL